MFLLSFSAILCLFVRISENTSSVQNFGAFLKKLFAENVILLKREVDSYIVRKEFLFFVRNQESKLLISFFQSEICSRIIDYRPMRNRRVGILPFVNYFAVS